MARVFITGSSDGLGRMAAQLLVEQGHGVLHARSEQRGEQALAAVPGAENVGWKESGHERSRDKRCVTL